MPIFVIALVLCSFGLCGEENLEKHFNHFFYQTEAFQKAHIGISVIDLSNGKEVYGRNQNQFFIPASLQKIVISTAALFGLGEDHVFETSLEYDGFIDDSGTLIGNLWVIGGGDPSLSLEIFDEWKKTIEVAHIQKIQGKIYVDTSCFETASASSYWAYEDLGNYYGAGAFGLSIHNNFYYVTFRPGQKEGEPAEVIEITPSIPDLRYHNEVKTGPAGSGDKVFIFGSEYFSTQYFRGTVPIDKPTFTVKGAIFDPPSFCAFNLQKLFEPQEGIEIVRNRAARPQKNTIVLSTHTSAPLCELLQVMNKQSVNLFAEHLLKTLGKGKAEQGALKVEEYLKGLGLTCRVKDGSGLARNNLITPNSFTRLLCHIHTNPFYTSLISSFPAPGQDGTLNDFPELMSSHFKAKTGTLSDCSNLGGFLRLKSGKEFAFSIFCNHFIGNPLEIKEEMLRFLNKAAEILK